MNTKKLLAVVAILLYTASFAQTKEQVAEMYLKMTANVDGKSEKEYRTYSLPIDTEHGEGTVSDFATLEVQNPYGGSAIYRDMMSSIQNENSKISEIAVYMSLYNILGIYEPVEDKALQNSMVQLKNTIVKMLKNSSYTIVNLKTSKNEYSNDNSLQAEVNFEITIPKIDYSGLPKTAQQNSNKEQAQYFNELEKKIQKAMQTKETARLKGKFTLSEIKIKGKSYWLPYQAFQVIDPIVYNVVQFEPL